MKKMLTILSLLVISSTVFAATPTVRCDREIYSAAASTLIKINLEAKGIAIKLDGIIGMENSKRTYFASLEMTDSTGFTRYDSYKVVLADMQSCKVQSSTLLAD